MTASRGILPKRRYWRADEEQFLRDHYAISTAWEIGILLERSPGQVHKKATKLGLRKPPEFYDSIESNSTRVCPERGASTRLKKGSVPWNKGTHWMAGGRSAETRFKKGRPASEACNYVPIGSLRISKDGCLERKITDDPALVPARRWVGVHRLVWEAAHGPVPAGHAVVFRAGRRSQVEADITLDALELVSRAELMRRNSYHRYGPEIARAVQLRGALSRQINKRAKAQREQEASV